MAFAGCIAGRATKLASRRQFRAWSQYAVFHGIAQGTWLRTHQSDVSRPSFGQVNRLMNDSG